MDAGLWRIIDVLVSRNKAVLVKTSKLSQEIKTNKKILIKILSLVVIESSIPIVHEIYFEKRI